MKLAVEMKHIRLHQSKENLIIHGNDHVLERSIMDETYCFHESFLKRKLICKRKILFMKSNYKIK